jgi:hypothetical protein
MAAALYNLPPELAGRIGREARRPHPLARLMADVRRQEGIWVFISLDGANLEYRQPYTTYYFKWRYMVIPKYDIPKGFALTNILWPVRSPDLQAAGG